MEPKKLRPKALTDFFLSRMNHYHFQKAEIQIYKGLKKCIGKLMRSYAIMNQG